MDELYGIVSSFICPTGVVPDIEKCHVRGPQLSKGGTKAICTVRLQHGHTYHLEFVYKFWQHILKELRFPLQPCFIITNNGLASTLKCFLCEPRDVNFQYGTRVPIACDVHLEKNTCVILEEEDFLKFKSCHVFPKDLPIYNSMVVCRTYLTEMRNAIQFFVVKPVNRKRICAILESSIPSDGQQRENNTYDTCSSGWRGYKLRIVCVAFITVFLTYMWLRWL